MDEQGLITILKDYKKEFFSLEELYQICQPLSKCDFINILLKLAERKYLTSFVIVKSESQNIHYNSVMEIPDNTNIENIHIYFKLK